MLTRSPLVRTHIRIKNRNSGHTISTTSLNWKWNMHVKSFRIHDRTLWEDSRTQLPKVRWAIKIIITNVFNFVWNILMHKNFKNNFLLKNLSRWTCWKPLVMHSFLGNNLYSKVQCHLDESGLERCFNTSYDTVATLPFLFL